MGSDFFRRQKEVTGQRRLDVDKSGQKVVNYRRQNLVKKWSQMRVLVPTFFDVKKRSQVNVSLTSKKVVKKSSITDVKIWSKSGRK